MNKLIYQREDTLATKLNTILTKVTGVKRDYYNSLSDENLISLKYALSDINNILTLKVALRFIDYMASLFKLNDTSKSEIVDRLMATSPNANGFDIYHFSSKTKIFAEIKSTIPMNQSNKFGIAQINSILDDAIKLQNGIKSMDTKDAYKFIGIIDLGANTDMALEAVFRPINLRTKHALREKRNLIKNHLELIDATINIKQLSKERIYVVKIII